MMHRKRSKTRAALDVELAKANITQSELARRLETPSTTLSDWLTGAHPAPENLFQRIEKALRLSPGTLLRDAKGKEPLRGGAQC